MPIDCGGIDPRNEHKARIRPLTAFQSDLIHVDLLYKLHSIAGRHSRLFPLSADNTDKIYSGLITNKRFESVQL